MEEKHREEESVNGQKDSLSDQETEALSENGSTSSAESPVNSGQMPTDAAGNGQTPEHTASDGAAPADVYQQGDGYQQAGPYQQGNGYQQEDWSQQGSYQQTDWNPQGNPYSQQNGWNQQGNPYSQPNGWNPQGNPNDQQAGSYQQGNPNDQRAGSYQQGNPYQQYGSKAQYTQYQQTGHAPYSDGSGFGIISMVLGILSLMLFCTCINVPLAIAAVILGVLQFGRGTQGRGMAIAGMVTAVLSVLALIVTVALLWAPFMRYYQEELPHMPQPGYDRDDLYEDDLEDFFDFFDGGDDF